MSKQYGHLNVLILSSTDMHIHMNFIHFNIMWIKYYILLCYHYAMDENYLVKPKRKSTPNQVSMSTNKEAI